MKFKEFGTILFVENHHALIFTKIRLSWMSGMKKRHCWRSMFLAAT